MQRKLLQIIVLAVVLFVLVSAVLYQSRKTACLAKKEQYIKNNLPSEYGPDTPFEKRLQDTQNINNVYSNCLYPWK